ncbi:hypothetical protein GGX14DRAFT_696599 [Mycena pura]|uniref:RRM domain-containing protein n=1 Tax=Mycena pura TaxID=153505 RepID=A0AAD6VJX8_9AGAR|nr:hypothetical protein GGX14DRAFT_696599 [Mycena pura]
MSRSPPHTATSTLTSSPRAPPTPPPDSHSRSFSSSPCTSTADNDAAAPAATAPSCTSSPSLSTVLQPTLASALASPPVSFPASRASPPAPPPPVPSLAFSPPTSYSFPTSVSSPAWFPSFDPAASPEQSPLVPSFSSTTLVDSPLLSPPRKSECKARVAYSAVHDFEPKHSALAHGLEDGEIVVGEQPASKELEPGQMDIDIDLPSQHPSAAIPARVPLPASPPSSVSTSATTAPTNPTAASQTTALQSNLTPTHALADKDKTPNVYINGLPPNFPEDQLFALAAPFGSVRSVRSFTRHVGDAETGYGFVLFDDIASAERCINSLRRYRNLHPTFSKVCALSGFLNVPADERRLLQQVHKIPGTVYSHVRPALASASASASASSAPSSDHGRGAASSLNGWEQESEGAGSGDSTFKARMERLSDRASTNLYIEGCVAGLSSFPRALLARADGAGVQAAAEHRRRGECALRRVLSLVLSARRGLTGRGQTLAALVSPYAIRSSRFFQTRLSTPPRIIAFVRLETRAAAEEIIERLHGRMVRGWNDPGSRISVRFADTAEQRELRRQERAARDDEHGQPSGQLSIAQATLLNLRGGALGDRPPVIGSAPGPKRVHVDEREREFQAARAEEEGYEFDFQSNAAHGRAFEVDYSRAPGLGLGPGPARFPHRGVFGQQQTQAQAQRMNPAMASLLESLQAQAQAQRGREQLYAPDAGADYRALQQQQQQQQQLAALSLGVRPFVPRGLGLGGGGGGAAQAGGYTPTEEFILRARSDSLQQHAGGKRRPVPLDLHAAQGVEHDAPGAAAVNIGMGVRGYRAQAATLSFAHAHGFEREAPGLMAEDDFHAAHQMQRPFDTGDRIMNQLDGAGAHGLHSSSNSSGIRISRHSSQQQQQQQYLPSVRAQNPNQTHEFGPHAPARNQSLSNQQTHHYQHQHNLSGPGNARTTTTIRPAPANNNSTMHMHSNSLGNNSNSNNGIYHDERGARHNGGSPHLMYSSKPPPQAPIDLEQASPPLVSPALTYSSRSSTAAFSPATPFFGSFDADEATFRAPHAQLDAKGKRVNTRTATR